MTLRISNENLRELGWPRLQQAFADRAATEPGRDAALALGFLPDQDQVELTLATVSELMQMLVKGGDLPLAGTREIRHGLMRARRGAVLSADELVDIARTAEAAHALRRHLIHHQLAQPILGGHGQRLPDLGLLASELAATFDDAGQVRDDASPELASARQRLIGLHRHMKDRLDNLLARPELDGVLQDNYYTLREDRYVVPVVSSFQRDVPGIIHGTSNSGETVFVEPTELIEQNNAIKVADAAVRMEIERVLRVRSEWVKAEADDLDAAFAALVELDVLQCKARLAGDLDATVPTFSSDGSLRLIRARNPHLLLKGSRVIPNDIELSPGHAFLVVTGPNTGGKTVTLSTVGTLVMLASAGCPIPASEGSVLSPFTSLWALIGDAQDIERDLSTFSGHLLAIQAILDAAQPGTLVLLDEIIVGTEPQQGAALAIAVLESLANRGARGFVTTHYERLKTLAFEDPRFGNASVGFDPVTFAPTFALHIGSPGSSNPFDVALRLGFPPHIVLRAREVAGGHSHLSNALERLQNAELAADAREAEARAARDGVAMEMVKLQAERQRLKRDARAEIDALAAKAREQIRSLLADIRARREALEERVADQRQARVHLDEDKRFAHRFETELKDIAGTPEPELDTPGRAAPEGPRDGGDLEPGDLKAGLEVWVRSLGKIGTITEIRNERANLAVGAVRTSAHVNDLARIGGRPVVKQQSPSKPTQVIAAPGNRRVPELGDDDERVPPPRTDNITADLRGARRDEVHEKVEPLLDRAWRDSIEAVWIIHGHGTGAIRDEVRELLARSPQVSGYRRGKRHEGGDGVTIAFLDRN